jgi:hypothetical protein
MRFGNSSDYFGLESNQQHWIAPNSATGKAFATQAQELNRTSQWLESLVKPESRL